MKKIKQDNNNSDDYAIVQNLLRIFIDTVYSLLLEINIT